MSSTANAEEQPNPAAAGDTNDDPATDLKVPSAIFSSPDNQAVNLEAVNRTTIQCLECGDDGELIFMVAHIPNFKDAEIVSFSCSSCGYSYRKVRSGLSSYNADNEEDAVRTMGRRLVLTVETDDDLKRTVLRSDTCTLSIPAAEIEVSDQEGAFTSVEGLLHSIRTAFAFMYLAGDNSKQDVIKADSTDNTTADEGPMTSNSMSSVGSSTATSADDIVTISDNNVNNIDEVEQHNQSNRPAQVVTDRLTNLINGLPEIPFKIILDDPLGEAFIGPRPTTLLTVPEINPEVHEDEQLHVEYYERTPDMNETLGLLPSNDYGMTAAMNSLHDTAIPVASLSVGDVVQARYLGAWLDCKVCQANDTLTVVWVEEVDKEHNGQWIVSGEDIRLEQDGPTLLQSSDEEPEDSQVPSMTGENAVATVFGQDNTSWPPPVVNRTGSKEISAADLLKATENYAKHVELQEIPLEELAERVALEKREREKKREGEIEEAVKLAEEDVHVPSEFESLD